MGQLDKMKPLPKNDFLNNLPTQGTPNADKVDLSRCETLICENCPSGLFEESVILKIISPIMSPTGKEEVAPIPVFSCVACGSVPERFLKVAAQARVG